MSRTPVSIPSTYSMDWQAISTSDGNVPGPVAKTLSQDEDSGAATYLMHLPPGWYDPHLDWHPATEESFKIAGWSKSGTRESGTPSYIHRPPGLLHGPTLMEAELGTTFLIRFDRASRIFRVPDGDQDQPMGPEYSAEGLIWHPDIEQVPRREVAAGPWAGTKLRELRRNRQRPGGLFLFDLPAGWEGEGARAAGPVEEFVLSGAVRAGDVEYTKWGYACRAAGAPAGRYASEQGAVLATWLEEDPE
jgi:hypothetical protein